MLTLPGNWTANWRCRPICDAHHPHLLAVKLPAVTGNSGSTPVVSGRYVHAEALSDFLTAFEAEIAWKQVHQLPDHLGS
jgi:hypothetical protein